MPNGYWGRILRVDLTSGKIGVEEQDEKFYRQYFGGWGIVAHYLLREVPVGCDPLGTGQNGYTLAPGQYGSTNDFAPADGATTSTHTITGLDGCDVYAVIHAAVLLEVPCDSTAP